MNGPVAVLCVDSPAERGAAIGTALDRYSDAFEVRSVESATAARSALAGESGDPVAVDCVVTAHRPGVLDGPSVVETVREVSPSMPVAVVTDEGDEEVAAAAIAAGVDAYVPIDGDTDVDPLAERVREVVDGRERSSDGSGLPAAGKRSSNESPLRAGGRRRTDPLFEAIFEDPKMLIGVLDGGGRLREANETAMGFVDADRDAVLDVPFWETPWWNADVRGDVREWVERAADSEYVEYDADLTDANGDDYSVEGTIRPVTVEGEVVSMVVSARDVTARRERERKLHALHEATRSLVAATDRETVTERAVETVGEVLGLPINGFWLYDTDEDTLRPAAISDRGNVLVEDPPAYTGEGSLSWEAFQDGEIRVYDDLQTETNLANPDTAIRSEMVLPIDDYGVMNVGSTVPGTFDDVDVSLARILTETVEVALDRITWEETLRARQAELERVRDRMEFAMDATDSIIWDLDIETGTSTTYGPKERLFQVDTDGWEDFLDSVVHEDDRQTLEDRFEAVTRDERDVFEAEFRTTGESGEPRWIHTKGIPREDAERATPHLVGFATDVTEQKQREDEVRRQNERLEQFASIVSHDLRNPLTTAMGRLELATEDCESEHLAAIDRSLDRMADIIEEMLDLVRDGRIAGEREMVALEHVARQTWNTAGPDDAILRLEELPTVRADTSGLKHVFENLFRNAGEHAASDDVTVVVGELADRDGFYVADDGPGIPESERAAVFDLGHTTADDGTGFGLAIVEEVVQAHGWEVTLVDSESGGARFEFSGVEIR